MKIFNFSWKFHISNNNFMLPMKIEYFPFYISKATRIQIWRDFPQPSWARNLIFFSKITMKMKMLYFYCLF